MISPSSGWTDLEPVLTQTRQERLRVNCQVYSTTSTENQRGPRTSKKLTGNPINQTSILQTLLRKLEQSTINSCKLNIKSMVPLLSVDKEVKLWSLLMLLCITITTSGWHTTLCTLIKLRPFIISVMWLWSVEWKWLNSSHTPLDTTPCNRKSVTFLLKTSLRTHSWLELPPSSHGDLDTTHHSSTQVTPSPVLLPPSLRWVSEYALKSYK